LRIKWLGHASVLITSDTGIKIITDPFDPGYCAPPGGTLAYSNIEESADIVAVTHEHPDHNNVATVRGNPDIVRGAEIRGTGIVRVKGIEFKSIPCYHDGVGGRLLGENNMLCFEVDGLRICHNGDLGHQLSDKQIAELGKIDILLLCVGQLVPVGEPQFTVNDAGRRVRFWNQYTINADVANQLYDQLAPKVIIPIHYSNDKCSFKLVGVEEFLKGKKNVIRMDTSEVEFTRGRLPADTQIIVVAPAL